MDELLEGLSSPAVRALVAAGLDTPATLATRREADVLALHGVSERVVARLREVMARDGVTFLPQPADDPDVLAVDDHLAAQPSPQRQALEQLRATLRKVLPTADEGIRYGQPCFSLHGSGVAGYGAAADHCSYAPMSGAVLERLADDVGDHATSKGVLRFPVDGRLPIGLVRTLVAARLDELGEVSDGIRREYHRNGRLQAEGRMRDGLLDGPWAWYRTDGSLLRSGSFTAGERSGRWIIWTRDGTAATTADH